MIPREVFDKAFKIAAVKLILEEGQSVKMVSSTLEFIQKSFISLDSRRRKIWRKSVLRTGERSSSCPKRKPSSRQIENEALKEIIKTIFYEHKERYRRGIRVNRKRIARLFHELCLYAKGSPL